MIKEGIVYLQISILILGFISSILVISSISLVSAADIEYTQEQIDAVFKEVASRDSSPNPVIIKADGTLGAWKQSFFSGSGTEYGLGGTKGMSTWWGKYGYGAQAIIQSAAWAGVAYGVVYMLGGLFGLDDAKTKAFANAAAAGFGAGRAA